MKNIRAALDVGQFSVFVKQFHVERARGV